MGDLFFPSRTYASRLILKPKSKELSNISRIEPKNLMEHEAAAQIFRNHKLSPNPYRLLTRAV